MVRNWKRVHGRRPVASLPEYGYTPTAIEFCGTVVIAFQMLLTRSAIHGTQCALEACL